MAEKEIIQNHTENSSAIPRVMLAAPGSGSGKTLVTCALLRILQKKQLCPAACKCGPDYIDPMFHRTVLAVPSRNLDLFLAGEQGVREQLALCAKKAGITLIEGAMGYFDGLGGMQIEGSAADVARVTDTPVLLVADVRGMGRSVLPLLKGFRDYDATHRIRGVILNRVSPSISGLLKEQIEKELALPVIGILPEIKDFSWGSRHLGLLQPEEIPEVLAEIDRAAELLQKTLDIEKLLQIAGAAPSICKKQIGQTELIHRQSPVISSKNIGIDDHVNDMRSVKKEKAMAETTSEPRKMIRLGIARDEGFSFYYEANLEMLSALGAELVPFSPIHDRSLPDVDGLLLGGGYPELYARELSENVTMREAIRNAAENGMPVLAECGGFLYLQKELTLENGETYPMAGFFDGSGFWTGHLVRFGYAELIGKSGTSAAGQRLRAHEFHYFDCTQNGSLFHAQKPVGKREWKCMIEKKNVIGGFPHLYYPGCGNFAEHFLEKCKNYSERAAEETEEESRA